MSNNQYYQAYGQHTYGQQAHNQQPSAQQVQPFDASRQQQMQPYDSRATQAVDQAQQAASTSTTTTTQEIRTVVGYQQVQQQVQQPVYQQAQQQNYQAQQQYIPQPVPAPAMSYEHLKREAPPPSYEHLKQQPPPPPPPQQQAAPSSTSLAVTTTTNQTTKATTAREAAAAQGQTTLRQFDQRVSQMLIQASSMCPMMLPYFKCTEGFLGPGYLCIGGHHYVSDTEVETMLKGQRPFGPRIESVNIPFVPRTAVKPGPEGIGQGMCLMAYNMCKSGGMAGGMGPGMGRFPGGCPGGPFGYGGGL